MDGLHEVYGRPAQRPRRDAAPPDLAGAAHGRWGQPHPPHHQQQQQDFFAPAGADGGADAPAAGAVQVQRWLSCTYKSGSLGVAAYDQLTNELAVLQVQEVSTGPCAFQMLQYIKLQVDPEVIILSAAAEPALVDAARLPAAAATGAAPDAAGDSSSGGGATIQLQRPSMFTYNKALQMVSAVQLRSRQGAMQEVHAGQTGDGRRPAAGSVSAHIDTTAQQQVAALGALVAVLLQLQDEEAGGPDAEHGMLVVEGISELTLDGHLVVDGPSLAALDIFKDEEHPSAMGIGSSKEGVSLYGLLQRCVTGMGRRLLRQWFLRPVVQLDVIADRHDTLELLLTAHTTNDALRAAMKKLHDLPRLLARLRLSQARPQLQTFKQLHDSITQLLGIHDIIAALAPAAAASGSDGTDAEPAGHDGSGGADALFGGAAGSAFFSEGSEAGGGADSGVEQPAFAGRGSTQAFGAVDAGPWDTLRITRKILHCLGPHLLPCCSLIADVLDLQGGGGAAEGQLVQPGVCPPLDGLRGTLDTLPVLLTQVVEAELMRVPAHIARRYSRQLWSVVYIPQVGFVMSVTGGRLSEELAELLPDYELAFMGEDGAAPAGADGAASASAAAAAAAAEEACALDLDRSCAYYTCQATQQLNVQYGDLQHKIQDLEASICTEVIRRLLQQHGTALTAAAAAVAELDCLCGFAAAARELGYCRPQLVRESVVHIMGGRHPLAELLAPGRFIDNDTTLGSLQAAGGRAPAAAAPGVGGGGGSGGGSRMLLITGPNASGKSVYMKQVALLVFMAHIGSFVPARAAVIGLTDRILTRLPSMESVVQAASSFMADLAQVSNVLSRATGRSLVLLDEFGKGTLTSDGVGLLAGVLRHYAAQPSPPLLLACTHFSELLAPGILPRSPHLQLCTMQVLVGGAGSSASAAAAAVNDEQQQPDEGAVADWEREHVFLYKLAPGVVASSYGLLCARLCGVDRSVIIRAADVQALQAAGQPVNRLQVPQLQQRDATCWQLARQLAAADVADARAVRQLLAAVVQAEAGGG